jgi:hypothetical protein
LLNIFAPVESTRSLKNRYSAQGLGDRIHLLTIAWALSNYRNEKVILHLSQDKLTRTKRTSFEEVYGLFPNPNFQLVYHDVMPETNNHFEEYLNRTGVNAIPFFYLDHPGWRESQSGIEVSVALKKSPLLRTPVTELQSNIVTSQWDTTGARRKFTPIEVMRILDCYRREGYEIITVGGESQDIHFRESLSAVGSVMSKSAFHVGVDSGFMHLAKLHLPEKRIHIYSKPQNFWSHHLFRGIDNGMILNKHFKPISAFELQLISWRYDSPRLLRFWHHGKNLLGGEKR